MKKVFVAFFSILLIVILLSASNVNAKVDLNVRDEVILGEKDNVKEEGALAEKETIKKPCVQSLSVFGETRRSNGHQNKDWYNMGSYVSTGSVSSDCFRISSSGNIQARVVGTSFEYNPLGHGKASVTVTVPSNCTCDGKIISRSAGFTFSEWGLLDLSITGYDLNPKFYNMESKYTVTIPNDVTSIKINGKSVDSGSDITISLNDTKISDVYKGKFEAIINNLKSGENEIKINVVTPENESRDTIITVTRGTGNGVSNDNTGNNSNNKVPTSSFFLIKDNCLNPDVLRIVRFVLILIDVVRFVVPMALIVYGSLDFSKAAVSGDEKAQKEKVNLFVKRLINAVALFLIPVIVEFLIVFLGDLANGSNFTDCIQNANKEKIAELQEELDEKREELKNGE